MITPGPASIDPGAAPGGFVVHAYRIPDGVLVLSQRITGDMDDATVEAMGGQGCDTAMADAPIGVVLVYYDGDTGDRAWTQPALL